MCYGLAGSGTGSENAKLYSIYYIYVLAVGSILYSTGSACDGTI